MAAALTELICVNDFERQAKKNLPKYAFDYFVSGAEEEQTTNDNKAAFKRYRLKPRLMRDVSIRDISTSILGHHIAFPIVITPTAKHRMAHPDGEIGTAKAAASMHTGMTLSVWATTSIEDVAAATPNGLKFFQLNNIFKDRKIVKSLFKRAEKAGYKGIVLTVDGANGFQKKYRTGKYMHGLPVPLRYEHFTEYGYTDDELRDDSALCDLQADRFTWEDFHWVKSVTSLPVILKGILTAEDARLAVTHKADGILVSNHGGRILDGMPATIDALADVAKAVQGSGVEVYLDGGIRRGTDVLKAIALGARAVFIGRPAVWGLVCNGEAGVRRILEILRDELDQAMALCGCSSLAEITPKILMKQPTFSSNL